MRRRTVAVVGAGIIGAAVARALSVAGDDVVVLEKADEPATHQSGHNSGVVHAGLYYPPGSAKARFTRRGVGLLKEYCTAHGLPYQECGKLLVARDDADRQRLESIVGRARANGVPGVRLLDASGLRDVEPHVRGVAGLHSPTTAVVDFGAVTRSLLDDAVRHGARIRTGATVTGFYQRGGRVRVAVGADDVTADEVVVCAGLHSDVLAQAAGDAPFPRIVPFRGEFARLRPERRYLVRGLVYPVPDPRYPFLGVHLTRGVNGEVSIGPNAVLALAREGYRRRDVSVREVAALAAWSGFRRFARANAATGLREVRGSLLRGSFVAAARHFIPELRRGDVVPGPSGVRAQAMDADGTLVDDFRTSRVGNVLLVRNAPSPAATASLAIADDIVATLTAR